MIKIIKTIIAVLIIMLVGVLLFLIVNYLTHRNDCCSCCPKNSEICIDVCCKCKGAIFK